MLTYHRLSKLRADADIAGGSLDKQQSRTDALAQQYGATVPEGGRFYDDGISAAFDMLHEDKPRDRPGFTDLLRAIERERPTYVGSVFGDRLTRNLTEWTALLSACARVGAKLVSESRLIDPRDHGDRLVGTVETIMAEAYVEAIRQKTRSSLADLRNQGLPRWGGRRPYGLEDDKVTPREAEAEHMRWMVARILAGDTYRDVCRSLNERGILTPTDARRADKGERPTGQQWHPLLLKQLLRRASNVGWIEHDGEMVRPYAAVAAGEVGTILDRETFDRLLAHMDNRGSKASLAQGRTAKGGHFLSALLRCATCHGAMHGSHGGGTKGKRGPGTQGRVYRCVNGHQSIAAEPVEAHVRALVLALRSSPEHMHGVAEAVEGRGEQWRKLHQAYTELTAEMDEIAEGDYPARFVQRRLAKLERERAQVKAEMDQCDPADPAAVERLHAQAAERVAREWDAATDNPTVRRKMVLDVVAGFRVLPAIKRGKRTPIEDRLEAIPLH